MCEYTLHECNQIHDGIHVQKSINFGNQESAWQLVVERNATESDVEENHYLEQVGDTIWSMSVEINFCPYCGATLNETKSTESKFSLVDSRGWSSEVL